MKPALTLLLNLIAAHFRRFKLVKGKIGEHVHAYVDGEMAGMFKGSK